METIDEEPTIEHEEAAAAAPSNQEINNDNNNEEEEERERRRKEKMRRKLMKEAKKARMRGVCYLSRVPPKMDPPRLRQILSQYADVERIYLAPEDPAATLKRKKSGGFRGQEFCEGWVEFTDKRVAKSVASMLNGEQIGGKKRSQFYYDIWNIKYLSKFKWDDLTEEMALRRAEREQKLAMEISAAKKERDFYLSKVDQSRALSSIEERLKKKTQSEQENGDQPESQQVWKVIRQFPQTQPVEEKKEKSKGKLSKELLAKVFNTSS